MDRLLLVLLLVLLGSATPLTVAPADAGTEGGTLLWQAVFDLAEGTDRATAVAAAAGRVVVVGSAQNVVGDTDFIVRAHDARSGALLWSDRVDVAGGSVEAMSVVMDDRHAIVAGTGRDSTGAGEALIRVYDARTGALAWNDRWPGSGAGLSLEGARLLVAGNIVNTAGENQLLVRAYAAKTGVIIWEDRSVPSGYTTVAFPVGTISFSEPRPIALSGGQAFVSAIVTPAFDSSGSACLVRAYDAAKGDMLWETARHVSGRCRPVGLARDGSRVILGSTGGFGGDELVVQAYEAATGTLLWQYRNLVGSGLENALTAVDTSGGLAFITAWDFSVAPRTTPGFKEAFIVRAFDTRTGVLRWEDVLSSDAFGFQLWHALDVETVKGRVFAVGQDVGRGTWFVRAYGVKDGDLLWHDEFQPAGIGGDYSWSQAVAVDGGRVFVAGSGFNAAGNVDFILRAYDAK